MKGSKFYIAKINEEHCMCSLQPKSNEYNEVFFDLRKTTLKKHDIQSGQSFRDRGSIN